MWGYRLTAPYTLQRCEVTTPDPAALTGGQVLLAFRAAGICGSDLPGFRGTQGRLPGDTGCCAAGIDGFPIHEIVGDVLASAHPAHTVGDRVVGWASGFDGLQAQVIADGAGLAGFDPELSPARAIGLQPLACVLYAMEQLGEVSGKRVAVIGQGSIGLLFSHAAKAFGAAHVTGVDPLDRAALAPQFGVDEPVRATSDRWIRHLGPDRRFDIVIEAVGHQVATLGHAIEAAAFGGTVFYFGVTDDDIYPISIRTMLRNNLTLKSGVTQDRRRMLAAADGYARRHPDLLPAYVSHTFAPEDAQAAFELACRPDPTRVKVVIA